MKVRLLHSHYSYGDLLLNAEGHITWLQLLLQDDLGLM